MKRNRWIRRVALAFLTILIAIVLLLLFLLGTTQGARMIVALATRYAPVAVTVDQVEGALLRTLTLRDVQVAVDGTTVAVDELAVRVPPGSVLSLTEVRIRELRLGSVVVTQAAAQPPPTQTDTAWSLPPTPELIFPLPIHLERLSLERLIMRSERSETVLLEDLVAIAKARASTVAIELLRFATNDLRWDLAGELTLDAATPVRLDIGWQWLDEVATLNGQLSLRGDRNRLDLEHTSTGVIESTLAGELTLLPHTPVTLALNLVSKAGDLEALGVPAAWSDVQSDIQVMAGAWSIEGGGDLVMRGRGPFVADWQGEGDTTAISKGRIGLRADDYGALVVDGAVELEGRGMALDARADALSLAPWSAREGQIDGALRLEKTTAEAPWSVQSEGLVVTTPEAMATLAGAVEYRELTDWSANLALTTAAETVALTLTGSAAQHRIDGELAWPGYGRANIAARGALETDRWRGELNALEMENSRWAAPAPQALTLRDPWRITAGFGGDVQAEQACFDVDDTGTLCMIGSVTEGQLQTRVTLRDWRTQWEPTVTSTALGTLAADVSVAGTLAAPTATAQVTVTDAGVQDRRAADVRFWPAGDSRMAASWEEGQLTVTPAIGLPGGASVSGNLSTGDLGSRTASLQGVLDIDLPDLSAINPLQSAFEAETGMLDAAIVLAGTTAEPDIELRAGLADGDVTVIPTGVRYTALAASVNGDPRERMTVSVAGKSTDGSFEVGGEFEFAESPSLSLNVSLSTLPLLALPDMQATVSSLLTVDWRDAGIQVRGEASVDSADITLRALPANAVARNDDIVQEGDQAVSDLPLDLDVSIDLGGATHLAGFGLDAQLEGDLRLRQTPTSELQGFGEVRTNNATYEAYGQSLKVTRGVLRFDGPLERPDLDIRAIRDVDDARVGVDITGPPTALQSSLFSQPDLPEVDILSLLLTGRRLDNANASEGDALSNAAITLGLKRAFAVSGAIRDTLGLDTLTVAGGGSEGRVLAGKQLSERLYLQYAYGVFDQVSSVLLRLQINSRLTLESISGDEQSVDLIYRVGSTGN